MFARELPAGAGAFKRRAGEVYLGLVRVFRAAFTIPPQGIFMRAQRYPFVREGQTFSSLRGTRIRGEDEDLFGSPGGGSHVLQQRFWIWLECR